MMDHLPNSRASRLPTLRVPYLCAEYISYHLRTIIALLPVKISPNLVDFKYNTIHTQLRG